jgi:hypothetical protein
MHQGSSTRLCQKCLDKNRIRRFNFSGDETKLKREQDYWNMDMYLLNSDITSIMKQEEQHVNKPILFYFWIVNVKIKTKEII